MKAFVIESGSEWVDKDFFVAALILLFDADYDLNMKCSFDRANEVMRVVPVCISQA